MRAAALSLPLLWLLGASDGRAFFEAEPSDPAALAKEAVALGRALAKGSASLPLSAGPWRTAKELRQVALAKALVTQAPIQVPASGKGLFVKGLPAILLLQNSSTIAAWSKGLKHWAWPWQEAAFDAVERAPTDWLDPARYDAVVFSSPGWWADFANPPGGPSRMPEKVALATRDYVEAGGTAIFVGIAQWDLERVWPRSLRLASLGPYKTSKLIAAPDAHEGGLALDPVGVAAERLLRGAATLIHHPAFDFPDGEARPIQAAYAFSAGAGWVLGLAFHPFEQDESLAVRAQRLVLNALLLAGAKRSQGGGEAAWQPLSGRQARPTEPPSPIIPASTATWTPRATPTTRHPTAIVVQWPSSTQAPRPRPSSTATAFVPLRPSPLPSPTLRATPRPKPSPTPRPRPSATRTPLPAPRNTQTRTSVPTRRPSLTLTPFLQRQPTARPSPTAAPQPTALPDPRSPARPAPLPAEQSGHALGCLSSSPEPFSDGGVYVFFCLRSGAGIKLSVFDPKGKLRYAGKEAWSGPGQGQVFFAGRDERGKTLQAGVYLYQIEARYGPGGRLGAESKQGSFTFSRSRSQR